MSDAQTRRGMYQHTRARREHLLELLQAQHGAESVQTLATQLGVSVSTVRRDLSQLQHEQRVARTYGGAIESAQLERSWRVKSSERLTQKRALAHWAQAQVPEHAVVLLDSGTTVAELSALLGERSDLTLATNGLSSLIALADSLAEVIVLGGRLRRPSESIVGSATLHALERLTPDLLFLGAEALDPERGINCPEGDQAAVKELMARNARATWVLADSEKLQRTPGFAYWAALPPGCGLVTNADAEKSTLDHFYDRGWRVVLV